MAKQLVPDTASVRFRQQFASGGGNPIEMMSTIYVRNTLTGWSLAGLTTLATECRDAFVTDVLPLLVDDLTLVSVTAEDEGADPGISATVTSGTTGGDTTDPASTAVAALVQFVGDAGGVPARGRIFQSGMSETDVTGNTLTGTFATALQAAWDNVIQAADGALPGNAVVLVSRSAGTPAELEDVRDARAALKAAIAATKRTEAVTNTLQSAGVFVRSLLATQRDRRS